MEKGAKKRTNYSEADKQVLLAVVGKYASVVENKSTKGLFVDKKKQVWGVIAAEYNSAAETGVRTGDQLKVLYKNIKRDTRKTVAEEHHEKYAGLLKEAKKTASADKKEMFKTGGGQYSASLTSDQEIVLAEVRQQMEPLPNEYDSAALYFSEADLLMEMLATSPDPKSPVQDPNTTSPQPVPSTSTRPTNPPNNRPTIGRIPKKRKLSAEDLRRQFYVKKNKIADFELRSGTVTHVKAIVRGTALLPCDLTSPAPNDSVVLVVWYKDEHTPIYSYDTRGPHSTLAKHWQEPNLDTRSFFRTMTEPPTLSIDNISEKDEGEYRCRIDYLRSPTKNLRVKLTVIVPPQKPTIIDERGKEVPSLAGPYEEGGEMKLTCIVTGGKPPPVITWWRAGTLLKSKEINSGFENVRSNQMIISDLQRSDQHAAFTCQASNNNISLPASATTSIEIYFRPLHVEILSSNNPFSADRPYEIPCQTFGSRPPAKITWWMDKDKELHSPKYNYSQTESPDGNVTTSTLTLVPTRQDNGRTLTCRASNHLVRNGVEEATVKLNVFYVPILHLSLGSNLNPEDIEEGDDVYFECKVNANPLAYKVLWKHNDQVMQHNQKGVIMNSGDLALQGVTRSQAGNYSCVASNVEGDGDSNTVELKIMYKPICRSDQKRIYGVARHEDAKILCEVESFPPPESFKWSFNNSAETIDVPQTRYDSEVHHFSSILTYTPVTELDYGTVMCWANNLAGVQQDPCIFHIIAAGKPDPPFNCTISNQTSESLEVECSEGFDGGQSQYFLLEVFDQQNGILQANVSAKFPVFMVSGLDPGKILKMVVYAANSKGRSDAVLLEGLMLKVAEKQTVLSLGTRDQLEIAPILGILVGIVTALLLVTVVILGALKVRAAHREGSRALRPGFLPVKEKVTLPLRSESEDLFEKDDKNPDVIPANKDSDYQLGSAVQTPGLNNSVTTAQEYETTSPQQASITPLAEAYMARDRAYAPQHAASNEVTYAELSLARPNSLEAVKNGVSQYGTLRNNREDATIYAQIDHGRRMGPPPVPSKTSSPMVSPVSSLFPTTKPGLYHREVVTVRTPLMGCQQESCV